MWDHLVPCAGVTGYTVPSMLLSFIVFISYFIVIYIKTVILSLDSGTLYMSSLFFPLAVGIEPRIFACPCTLPVGHIPKHSWTGLGMLIYCEIQVTKIYSFRYFWCPAQQREIYSHCCAYKHHQPFHALSAFKGDMVNNDKHPCPSLWQPQFHFCVRDLTTMSIQSQWPSSLTCFTSVSEVENVWEFPSPFMLSRVSLYSNRNLSSCLWKDTPEAPVGRNGSFSHSLRDQSIMAGKRYLQEHVGAGHCVPMVGKQRGITSA